MRRGLFGGEELAEDISDADRIAGLRGIRRDAKDAAVDALDFLHGLVTFDAGAADWFGRLKHRLKATMIQDRDLLIASTALAHGYALVTNNTKHFQRIDELVLLDWTVPT